MWKNLGPILLLLVVATRCHAQAGTTEEERRRLIDASQTSAMPLLFDVNDPRTPAVDVAGFSNEAEFSVRAGLPCFFDKAAKGKNLTIGYIGGSITRADCQYRKQSAKFIQDMFPQVKVRGINAGVSGTGSDLGACRLQEQVLKYKPDLVFVEFAVNEAFADGVEGIIRQIRKYDASIDICLIYTVYEGQEKLYADHKVPGNIAALDRIAEHYHLPSVHMGLRIGIMEKEGKLVFKGDSATANGTIIFSKDGVHPTEAGGSLYASAIARAMIAMKGLKTRTHRSIPAPMITDNWEDAKMFSPLQIAVFSPGWSALDPANNSSLKEFSAWFPTVMTAQKPGDYFEFSFRGSMFGFFDIGGPEVGQLEVTVDDKNITLDSGVRVRIMKALYTSGPTVVVNRFNAYCNNRYRGQYLMVVLEPGLHKVRMAVSGKKEDKAKILGQGQLDDIKAHPEKYDRSVIYLGKILIRGEMVK